MIAFRRWQCNIRTGRINLLALMLSILLGTCVRPLAAQAVGGITGTVTDISGAAVSGADVIATNTSTGVSQRGVSSSAGIYSIAALSPGHYSVHVTERGFKTGLEPNVLVEIEKQTAVNFALSPGETSETVQVSASAVTLNTEQPSIGTELEPELIRSAPLEISGTARQIDTFVFLAPGVQGNTFMKNINGGVTMESEIEFNGIPDTQAETPGYQTLINPPYEMVNEFRIDRSTFSAQFGLAKGAQSYNMASGGNRFHGDGFEIVRNQLFDSSGFFPTNFSRHTGQPAPPIDQENNYGFTISGPVWIPKAYNGKGKTFFLYSSDWFKQNLANTAIGTVPLPAEKQGDFSGYKDANGNVIPIYDPQTGQQFPGNVIPTSRFSSLSASVLPLIPDPDRTGVVFGQVANKSPEVASVPVNAHIWGYTIDHNFSDTQSIHWSHWRNVRNTFGYGNPTIVPGTSPLGSELIEPNLGTGMVLTYSKTVKSNLVVTAGAAWMGEINNDINPPNDPGFAGVQKGVIFPDINFDGQNAITNWGPAGGQSVVINRKLGVTLENNWVWTTGRHIFNIGGEYRRSYQDLYSCGNCAGVFNFSQRTTSTPSASNPNFGTDGSSFASFLLGEVDNGFRIQEGEVKLRNRDFSGYVQDDFKFNRRLTLNLGVRWDIMIPFTENHDQIVYLNPSKSVSDPGAGNIAGGASAFGDCTGCSGLHRAAIHYAHLGPRFGFSYMLNNKTLVQGGAYVAFLDGGAFEYGDNKVGVSYESLLAGEFNRNSTGTSAPGYGSWDTNPMPLPASTAFTPSIGNAAQIHMFDPAKDGQAPYSEAWNVNVQRQLPWNMFLTAAYVGSKDIHLPAQLNNPNQPNPSVLQYESLLGELVTSPDAVAAGIKIPYPEFTSQFGSSATVLQALLPYPQYSSIIKNFDAAGTSFYNALQVQGEKRFSDGLSYLASFTMSRNMANVNVGFSEFASLSENRYNQKAEYTVSPLDQKYAAKFAETYELPIGHGKKFLNSNGLVSRIAGDWQVSALLDYEGGTAFGVVENGNPLGFGSFNRPNRVQGVGLKTFSYKRSINYFSGKTSTPPVQFTTNGFAVTSSQYQLGDGVANYPQLRNPPIRNENFSMMKSFRFAEGIRAILRVDYFNAFNRVQLNAPVTNASSSLFGLVLPGGANGSGDRGTATYNRQGQATFRVEF